MNQRVDFTNLGGLPVTQFTTAFMQSSYINSLMAIAKLCGDKTILFGCEQLGSNVSSGWISYNGELLPLVGGSLGTGGIKVIETVDQREYENTIVHNVYFTKTAVFSTPSDFNYNELSPLLSLKNIWKKDDIRSCVKDAAYEAANFDVDGYGTSVEEKGWRIFSKQYTDAAGAVLVNKKDGDTEFGVVGNFGGAKTHVLTIPEMPSHSHVMALASTSSGLGYIEEGSNVGPTRNTSSVGGNQAHNNLQPYFVVLQLIKL